MKILYYDCFSGISGDMNLGAMLDLGVDKDLLLEALALLNLGETYEIEVSKACKKGISGTRVEINLTGQAENKSNIVNHARKLTDIKKIIVESGLSTNVKTKSIKMFELLAEAEAHVHGVTKEEVHFHEVGATDAILDIVGAAFCLDYLKVDKVLCSSIELGGGFVRCEHGLLPVPAPAVVKLLKNVPVKIGRVQFETTTPTGAAILVANVQEYTDQLDFRIMKTGYGVGKRDLEIPNVLRVYLGEVSIIEDSKESQELEEGVKDFKIEKQSMVETNIDDMNPEYYEYIEERLFSSGALDVFKTPIIMKKGRPAIKLSVLVNKENISTIEQVIFSETSAIGLRIQSVEKKMLYRKKIQLPTKFGLVSVKYSFFGDRSKAKPEYEDCKRLAKENNVALLEVYEEIYKIISQQNDFS